MTGGAPLQLAAALHLAAALLFALPLACSNRPVTSQPEPSDAGAPREDTVEGQGVDGGAVCTSCGACELQFAAEPGLHVEGAVEYTHWPPTTGAHNPCWADWLVYDAELPAENWVHNLEHGGVVLLHDCDGDCDDEIAAMASFHGAHERTLVTQFRGLGARFAIVAWSYRLVTDCWDEGAFEAFYDAHFARAPENISAGAPDRCRE